MTDTELNERKISHIKKEAQKRKRRRLIVITAILVFVIAVVAVGGYLLYTFRSYSSFSVTSSTQLAGASDNLNYEKFADGYIQSSNSGIVYFDRDGIIWDESFSMARPIIDICEGYIAACDMKQNDIYIYDKTGLASHTSSSHDIIDIEISQNGLIALATNDSECNYIELKDINGNDIINVKSVFSSSGYLSDITLSEDGTKLAAAFIYISQGSLESRVLFYDFSNSSTDDMLVGGFSQYAETVITDVEFMNGSVVCAFGDNAMTFYSFGSEPSIISEELNLEWEIQSVYINSKNVLVVAKDPEGVNNYHAYVYNNRGTQVADVGFDFAYSKARLAGNNILLHSSTDCQLISFKGRKRYSGTFGTRISYLLPISTSNYILATSENVQFIKLK